MSVKIARHASNRVGRDFVVGDIHGELQLLLDRLAAVNFDATRDRLFSVGDLVDRGPDSPGVLALLDEPWFFAVQGNHENLLMDAALYGIGRDQWLAIGGEWSRAHSRRWLRDQALRLEQLPHVRVVGEGTGRFQVVHAGLVEPGGRLLTDADLDGVHSGAELDVETLIWSRLLARDYWRILQGLRQPGPLWHEGLSLTFCGHTPVLEPGLYRSHYFLDGGSGYGVLAGLRAGEPFMVDAGLLLRTLVGPPAA